MHRSMSFTLRLVAALCTAGTPYVPEYIRCNANRCTRARSPRAYTHPRIDTSAVQRRVMRRHKRARFVAATRRAHARGYARVKSTTCAVVIVAVYDGARARGASLQGGIGRNTWTHTN